MINTINSFFFFFNIILIIIIICKVYIFKQEHFKLPSKVLDSQKLDESTKVIEKFKYNPCSYDESIGSKSRNICYKECTNSDDTMCDQNNCTQKCYDEETSNWVNNTCLFKPFGDTKFNCTKICTQKDNCNYLTCKKLCESCRNKEDCPWYNKIFNTKNELVKESIPDNIELDKPLPPVINIKVKEAGIVSVEFPIPFQVREVNDKPSVDIKTLDPMINHFMYLVKKRDADGPVRIGTYYLTYEDKKIREQYNKYYSEKEKDEKEKDEIDIPFLTCEIKSLKPDDFYNITFKSYNNALFKLSNDSNIVTINPRKYSSFPKNTLQNGSIIIDNTTELNTEPEVCNSNNT